LDPDLEQSGNTNLVVRLDPATGDTTAFSSAAGDVPDATRGRPRMRWPMFELYAGKCARTVLKELGAPQGLPGYPTPGSNTLNAILQVGEKPPFGGCHPEDRLPARAVLNLRKRRQQDGVRFRVCRAGPF
jgi:hypothetical protein